MLISKRAIGRDRPPRALLPGLGRTYSRSRRSMTRPTTPLSRSSRDATCVYSVMVPQPSSSASRRMVRPSSPSTSASSRAALSTCSRVSSPRGRLRFFSAVLDILGSLSHHTVHRTVQGTIARRVAESWPDDAKGERSESTGSRHPHRQGRTRAAERDHRRLRSRGGAHHAHRRRWIAGRRTGARAHRCHRDPSARGTAGRRAGVRRRPSTQRQRRGNRAAVDAAVRAVDLCDRPDQQPQRGSGARYAGRDRLRVAPARSTSTGACLWPERRGTASSTTSTASM